jgi:hypothetical protein
MNTPNLSDWGPCPPGEWQRLASALSFRKWLLLARGLAIALAAAAALGGGAWAFARQFGGGGPETHQCSPMTTPCESGKDGGCGTK